VIEHLQEVFQRHLSLMASPLGDAVVQRKEIDGNQDSTAETVFSPCVPLLNNFSCVGKYNIAQQLEIIIPEETSLIDNHMLVDPAEVMYPGRTPERYQLRTAIKKAVVDSIKDLKSTSITVLMSSCLSSSPADIEVISCRHRSHLLQT